MTTKFLGELRNMKKRKGFKKIVVDGVEYQYAVSLTANILIVYKGAIRHMLDLTTGDTTTWRGKHRDGAYGRKEVAEVIRGNLGVA